MGKPQLIRLAARFVIVAYDIPAALCGALADIVKTGYNFDMPPRIGIL